LIQFAELFRKKFGEDEKPKEHLHDQRHVAEDLDVQISRAHHPLHGVVRSVPTSAPIASAMTQAARAVARVQPRPTIR